MVTAMTTTPTPVPPDLSDDERFAQAVSVVSRPKAAPANSFELHAPLELLARRILLDRVDPARREAARRRITWVAEKYAQAGASVAEDEPEPPTPAPDELVASLSAAAHAPIFTMLVSRVAPHCPTVTSLARPLMHELNRYPDWKIEWIDAQPLTGSGDEHALTRALLDTPRLGVPGSDFIFPIMHQVDSKGVAAEVIGPVLGVETDFVASARAIARVAAWSMLQDDPAHAPYGWTHCLTLAQAAAGMTATVDDPLRALAVAATHVVGFRAALSHAAVIDRYEPEPVGVDALAAFDAPPEIAAAAVHHAPASAVDAITTELASRAALHPDAHVAKYTLACFDAAQADPDHARLFLAAAAFLHGWWAQAR
jgi:hypothetical protein